MFFLIYISDSLCWIKKIKSTTDEIKYKIEEEIYSDDDTADFEDFQHKVSFLEEPVGQKNSKEKDGVSSEKKENGE